MAKDPSKDARSRALKRARTPVTYSKRTGTGTFLVTSTPTSPSWDTVVSENLPGGEITFSSGVFTVASAGYYRFGAYLTVNSTAQRAQAVAEVYIDGVAVGDQRSGSYIRNAGAAYDWWALEVSPEVFSLSAGQTIEVRVGNVTGASYGYAGTQGIACHEDKSRCWLERISAGQKGDPGPSVPVGSTAPSSPSQGDLWFDSSTDVHELFAYDATRSKWLGANSWCVDYGRSDTIGSGVGHWARLSGNRDSDISPGAENAFRVPYDCTVVGWSWSTSTNTTGWTHRIGKYDDSAGTGNGALYTHAPSGSYDDFTELDLDLDFDQGDLVGISAISGTASIVKQNYSLVIRRRTS
jgi:hypothetical protein